MYEEDLLSSSDIFGSDVAISRTLLLKKVRRVVEKLGIMESKVSRRPQPLYEIVKSRASWKSSDKKAFFSSDAVHRDCVNIIFASNIKKELKALLKLFDTNVSANLVKAVFERSAIEKLSRHLKNPKDRELEGPKRPCDHDVSQTCKEPLNLGTPGGKKKHTDTFRYSMF